MPSAEQYDLRSPRLPRLVGRSLRLSVRCMEGRITGPMVIRRLFGRLGVAALRRLRLDEEPTFRPFAPAAGGQSAPGAGAAGDLGAVPPDAQAKPTAFAYATVHDYAEAYRRGAATPEDVAEIVIDAVAASDAADPPLRAFISCDRDDVMAQARAATRRLREGGARSLLDGVPVAVKDEFDVAGYATTVGTRFLGRTRASCDATVVGRIRSAGGIIIGKTNMHEIGIGVTGMNPHHGTPRNPHGPAHHTGGSSSGSAAAVAAGLCPVALGADGGGSVRIPAAMCGVVGLKPTYARVSEFGATQLDWSVAHIGPIAATPRDAAIAYAVIAGPDPKDPATLPQPPVSLDRFDEHDLDGITLGIYRPWFEDADPHVVQRCHALVSALALAGARVRDIVIPELEAARVAHLVIISSEMAAAMYPYYDEHRNDFSLEVRADLALARSLSSGDYIQAQRMRTRAIGHFQPDALPYGIADPRGDAKAMRFAFPANLTGLPAITFPAGAGPEGLPVGLQVIGRYWREHVLLRVAQAATRLVERREPQVFFDVLPRAAAGGASR